MYFVPAHIAYRLSTVFGHRSDNNIIITVITAVVIQYSFITNAPEVPLLVVDLSSSTHIWLVHYNNCTIQCGSQDFFMDQDRKKWLQSWTTRSGGKLVHEISINIILTVPAHWCTGVFLFVTYYLKKKNVIIILKSTYLYFLIFKPNMTSRTYLGSITTFPGITNDVNPLRFKNDNLVNKSHCLVYLYLYDSR